jgi:putative oxidoreductase
MTTFVDTWTPRALAVLRIVSAFLFLQHGTAKLLGFPATPGGGGVALASLPGVAGLLELVGGGLLLIGLFTRPVAFVLSGEMAVAYFLAHAPRGHLLSPSINQGEPAVLFCFIFLFLAVAGAGAWSADSARGRG